MNKLISLTVWLLMSVACFAQSVGKIDRKTKEFSIAPNQKTDYTIYGYQFANATTQKMICFASNQDVVRANANDKLGAYFDTFRIPPGAKILYLGVAGAFAKMNFVAGDGKKTIFYIPKTSFVMM
jgi:hypothetical protein